MSKVSHEALYQKLQDSYIIDKCEQYAHWTLPQLMADFAEIRSSGGRANVERDYQSVGALLTNHLSSKLARLLFPANHPFFRIGLSDALKRMAQEGGVQESELQSALAEHEQNSCKRLFLNASYAQLILALKWLIVTGNVLLYRDTANGSTTAYGMQCFVTRRDGRGGLIDCVHREGTYVEALSQELQDLLRTKNRAKYSRPEQEVTVYTRIHRKMGTNGNVFYEVSQEIDNTPVGEVSTYPAHLCPWIVATWSLIPGEHYGRGMVEDYAGGFAKLSDLSEAHALYSVEIMRVINLVSSGSGTDIDDIATAETGEYVRGDPNTVAAHEAGDAGKLQQTGAEIERVYQQLSRAFMYQANTRDAERVTAYELQQEAQEAEHALGGVYSSLSQVLQLPLAHLLLVESRSEMLEGIVTGDVKLDIAAGLEALGRSSDVQNLLNAAQEAAAIVPALTQIDTRVNPHRVMDMVYAGRSVNTKLIHKTKAEIEDEQAADQQIAEGQQQVMQAAAGADTLAQIEALQSVQGPA